MKYYLLIEEDLTMDEISLGIDPQIVRIEVANEAEAIATLPQYEGAFAGRSYRKRFFTNKHAEHLACVGKNL